MREWDKNVQSIVEEIDVCIKEKKRRRRISEISGGKIRVFRVLYFKKIQRDIRNDFPRLLPLSQTCVCIKRSSGHQQELFGNSARLRIFVSRSVYSRVQRGVRRQSERIQNASDSRRFAHRYQTF